jgi:hypothetical protein
VSIQELEQQLLSLDPIEQLRIIQLLSQKISQRPNKSTVSSDSMISFGMFSGPNQSTEADFKLAEFQGDSDDGLNW